MLHTYKRHLHGVLLIIKKSDCNLHIDMCTGYVNIFFMLICVYVYICLYTHFSTNHDYFWKGLCIIIFGKILHCYIHYVCMIQTECLCPPNRHCWNLTPYVMILGGGAFERLIRLWVLSVLINRDPN